MIDGGLRAGELGILLAPPKGYKSGTMINFSFNAMLESTSCNVAYITLELSEDLVAVRLDLRTALATKSEIKSNPTHFAKYLRRRQEQLFGRNEMFIKAFKTKTCTCDTVRSYLDMLYSKHDIKIGLLVIDYLDLMKSSRPRDKDYLEAVDVCEDLRSVASKEEYSVPVWTACRSTREAVGKKRINMAMMSKAFERVGVADIVIGLCQTEEEKLNREMRLVPVAMRNDSSDHSVLCTIDYDRMKMVSVGVAETEFEDEEPRKYAKREKDEPKVAPPKDIHVDVSDRRHFAASAKKRDETIIG
jgi:replicative DNA helicase